MAELFILEPHRTKKVYTISCQVEAIKHIWPARFPDEETVIGYGNQLAPFIAKQLTANPNIVGDPTDPNRFSDFDLLEREASYGRSGFSLQFQLDTRLSDALKYPLRVSDLIVTDVATDSAPEKLVWASDKQNVIEELPNVAMSGDHFHRPAFVSDSYAEFTGSVMSIDPSGRGKDETGYAVVNMLNGYQFVRRCGGIQGGYNEEVLTKLATIAKEEEVNEIITESNFGDGLFNAVLTPVLKKIYPVTLSEVRSSKQKELRICDTLEPVMNQHKLVFDKKVIKEDFESTRHLPTEAALRYSLVYQMTRISRDKGALANDDRLDALAMAVAYWSDQMSQDVEDQMAARQEERIMAEVERTKRNASLGYAVIVGHQSDLHQSSLKW